MKTLSISEAKRSLGAVADQALNGEKIVIIRKSRLLTLQEYEPVESIPQRPPGYFNDVYTKAEIKELNRLASRSAKRPVR
ncbi:MAG: type II toxin-antitoxin system Phd/YefM family antitoxin [Methylacidiphilales bacterium]|nr:type II toxin-antitoxin system Phd/YefM family antitoxin [Candidatus Methylacidiphilales bacterium]